MATNGTISFDDPSPDFQRFTWKGRAFVLREPTAGGYAIYDSARADAVKYDPATGNRIGYTDLGAVDAVLVAQCLREERTGGEFFLSLEEVRAMPARIVNWAFAWCAKRADQRPEDVPGKASAAGPGGSDSPTNSDAPSAS